MVTIGVDPHKDTHQAVAVDDVARQLSERTCAAVADGFGELLAWARDLGDERVGVIEDCRHVSGPVERFLLDHGERVARLAPHLMAQARTQVATRGKSDPIDALAVARAALAHRPENLPTARLAGADLEIRLIHQHHQRMVKQRTALINDLRWNLHDLWPELKIPRRRLREASPQTQIARRLATAEQGARVRVARDELRRVRELTRMINHLIDELTQLISGRTDRHRLDRGGNRQLNYAVHMIALTRLRHDPETALYIARQRERGKTQREAIRSLKRHLIRRIWQLLTTPNSIPTTVCLT
jgi:transposase